MLFRSRETRWRSKPSSDVEYITIPGHNDSGMTPKTPLWIRSIAGRLHPGKGMKSWAKGHFLFATPLNFAVHLVAGIDAGQRSRTGC